MSLMKAWVLHGVGDLRLDELPIPEPQAGEALIRLHACGVCGSDIPRIFETGTYHFPTVPGHEMAGEIASIRADCQFRVGDRVCVYPLIPCHQCFYCQIGEYTLCRNYDFLGSRCNGGFAEYTVAPASNLIKLPDQVSYAVGAMTEPLAVALHAVRTAAVSPVATVAVLGCGPIGMMVAWWARLSGAHRVFVTDVDRRKLCQARADGFPDALDARQGAIVASVLAETEKLGVDVAFEAAGVPETVLQAIEVTRPLGRVIIIGNPSQDVTLPRDLLSQVLRKQLVVQGTWSSTAVAGLGNEWATVLQVAAEGRIPVERLISHRVPLWDALSTLEAMRDRVESFSRVILTM